MHLVSGEACMLSVRASLNQTACSYRTRTLTRACSCPYSSALRDKHADNVRMLEVRVQYEVVFKDGTLILRILQYDVYLIEITSLAYPAS